MQKPKCMNCQENIEQRSEVFILINAEDVMFAEEDGEIILDTYIRKTQRFSHTKCFCEKIQKGMWSQVFPKIEG